jgi:hypothetical protein
MTLLMEQGRGLSDTRLKESTIGIDVFGRTPGYDSTRDAIVRTSASRLRTKLAKYYETAGVADPWLLELPPDGYVPQIRQRTNATVAPPQDQAPDNERASVVRGAPRNTTAAWIVLSRRRLRSPLFGTVLGFLTAGALAVALNLGVPGTAIHRSVTFQQVTHDGRPKGGPVLTDGSQLYFMEMVEDSGESVPVAIPAESGPLRRLEPPGMRKPRLLDLANNRFLLGEEDSYGVTSLWEWTPGTAPKFIANSAA